MIRNATPESMTFGRLTVQPSLVITKETTAYQVRHRVILIHPERFRRIQAGEPFEKVLEDVRVINVGRLLTKRTTNHMKARKRHGKLSTQ